MKKVIQDLYFQLRVLKKKFYKKKILYKNFQKN